MPKKHDFPKEKGMPIRCRVYVPSTQGMIRKISAYEHKKRAEQVKKKMVSLFGGSTKIKAGGSWFSKNMMVSENILLVESYTTREKWRKYDNQLKSFLNKKKVEWQQESLSIEWEDLSKNLDYEGLHFL